MQKALENHDEVSADPSSSDAQIEESIQWLTAFYRRLYYLDKLHIMIEKPDGHPEYHIKMTEAQKVRNAKTPRSRSCPYV